MSAAQESIQSVLTTGFAVKQDGQIISPVCEDWDAAVSYGRESLGLSMEDDSWYIVPV